MKPFAKFIVLVLLTSLSGCAFLKPLKQGSFSNPVSNPGLQTFMFGGALIYYKDLSNPCDDATVVWNDLQEVSPFKRASLSVAEVDCDDAKNLQQSVDANRFEIHQQFSIPFESRKTELPESGNAKRIDSMSGLVTANTLFQIHGAAGTVGKRSEALGLARASAVRDRLISMGVQPERITIMPYDTKIPGLQALVKVLTPVIL